MTNSDLAPMAQFFRATVALSLRNDFGLEYDESVRLSHEHVELIERMRTEEAKPETIAAEILKTS